MKDQSKLSSQVELVDRYCAIWNETDHEKRITQLIEIWEGDAIYVDPRTDLKGVEALNAHINKIQQSRPRAKIVRTSKLQVHHQIGRFKWQVIQKDGSKLPEGLDIVYFSEDDRTIRKIIGFFGEVDLI